MSRETNNNTRHRHTPHNVISRWRYDSGCGNISTSSVSLPILVNARSTTMKEKPSNREHSQHNSGSSLTLKSSDRGREIIPVFSQMTTPYVKHKPDMSHELRHGNFPTTTQLNPSRDKTVSTSRGWGSMSDSIWPKHACNKDKSSEWDKKCHEAFQ